MLTVNFEKSENNFFADVSLNIADEDRDEVATLTFVEESDAVSFDEFRANVLQQLLIGALKMLNTGFTVNYTEVYDADDSYDDSDSGYVIPDCGCC